MSANANHVPEMPTVSSLVEQFRDGMDAFFAASDRTSFDQQIAALGEEQVFIDDEFGYAVVEELADRVFDERAVPIYPRHRALRPSETTAVFRVGTRYVRLIGSWDERSGQVPTFIPAEQWLDQTAARAISGWSAAEWHDRLRAGNISGLYRDPATGRVPPGQRPRVATRAFVDGLRAWIAR